MAQIEVRKGQEYYMYFKLSELKSWGKRSAVRRSRFVPGFHSQEPRKIYEKQEDFYENRSYEKTEDN